MLAEIGEPISGLLPRGEPGSSLRGGCPQKGDYSDLTAVILPGQTRTDGPGRWTCRRQEMTTESVNVFLSLAVSSSPSARATASVVFSVGLPRSLKER